MPTTLESPARRKVTDTHGPFLVGDFHVLRVGGTVALHFGTPAGRFIFHVGERTFVAQARAEHDGHRNPWRSLADIDRERAESEAIEVPPPEPAPEPEISRELTVNERAWDFLTRNLHLSVHVVALKFGLNKSTFQGWISQRHPRELTEMRKTAGMPLRVLVEKVTDPAAPLLKPSGKLL